QMPHALTRTSTSAGPTPGASTSATANDPGAVSSNALTSPDDPGRPLDVARQIVLARHLAEVGVRRVRVRVVEDDDVEGVEELDVELRAHPSAQRHLLDDRDVPQFQERAAQAVHARREVAQVVDQADARVGALL